MSEPLSPSAQKVQESLTALGFSNRVVEHALTTRTSADAARAVGCRVEQIAKSLVFRAGLTDRPVLVVASGSNRVNEARVAEHLGEPLLKADADFVRRRTGFVIGGVPPVGHAEKMEVFIDEDLLTLAEIWAAAGTPNAVFRLTPAELVAMTRGKVVGIK
jgi:prolyl-tRNA editing enzyme YbaK/EbsC (Cys-tRNA(Pro) deacylase)